jgi:hypothetical protein
MIQPAHLSMMADIGLFHVEHAPGHHSFRARGLLIDYWPKKQKWQINKGPVRKGFASLLVEAEREVSAMKAEDMPSHCEICGKPAPAGHAFHRRCIIQHASKGCNIHPDAFMAIGARE